MMRGGAWDDLPAWDEQSGWAAGGAASTNNGGREGRTSSGGHRAHAPNNNDDNNSDGPASPSRPTAPAGGGDAPPPPLVTMNGTLRDLCERIRDRLGDLQGEWAQFIFVRKNKRTNQPCFFL